MEYCRSFRYVRAKIYVRGIDCSEVKKDMNKKTCDTTMPMIEAISCSNYTGEQATLCNYARPFLMTRAECASAEDMAKGEKMGPNKEKCENQTFGSGTGSWSYVLACSWSKEVIADQDGQDNNSQPNAQNQPNGPVSDPACIQKLKGMGVTFNTLGRVFNGSYNGTTCYIENAVSLSGTNLPFGHSMTMACDTAVAMENLSIKLKALGVTGYSNDIGSLRTCGPKRDKRGDIPGTITGHSKGWAVDFGGIKYGGRTISMANIHNPSSPDGQIALAVKAAACSTFKLVLSPTYKMYIGAFVHNHVEWGNQTDVSNARKYEISYGSSNSCRVAKTRQLFAQKACKELSLRAPQARQIRARHPITTLRSPKKMRKLNTQPNTISLRTKMISTIGATCLWTGNHSRPMSMM